MRKLSLLTLAVTVFFAAAFGWHLLFAQGVKREIQKESARSKVEDVETAIAINVFTNVITVTVAQPAPASNSPLEILGRQVTDGLVEAVAPGVLESKVNSRAREYYDLYAMVVPFKVQMVRVTKGRRSKLGLW